MAESCTGSTAACPGQRLPVDATSAAARRASATSPRTARARRRRLSRPTRKSTGGLSCRRPACATTPRAATAATTIVRRMPSSRRATVCRASGGVCDVAENCTGSSAACPADAKSTARLPCGAPASATWPRLRRASDDCPADVFRLERDVSAAPSAASATSPRTAPDRRRRVRRTRSSRSSTVCRAAAGVCDDVENCTGLGGRVSGRRQAARPTAARRPASATSPRTATASTTTARPTPSSRAPTVCRPDGRRLRRRRELHRHRRGVSGRRRRAVDRPYAAARPASATSPRTATAPSVNCPAQRVRAVGRRRAVPVNGVLRHRRAVHRGPVRTVRPTPSQSSARLPSVGRRLRHRRELHRAADANCPADAVEPTSTVCRPAASTADAPESCDGTQHVLSRRRLLPCRHPCDDGGFCTVDDEADGFGNCVGETFSCESAGRESVHRRLVRLARRWLPLRAREQRHLHRRELRQLRGRPGDGETCDPPNLALDPVNGQINCRLDCTSCGDGVVSQRHRDLRTTAIWSAAAAPTSRSSRSTAVSTTATSRSAPIRPRSSSDRNDHARRVPVPRPPDLERCRWTSSTSTSVIELRDRDRGRDLPLARCCAGSIEVQNVKSSALQEPWRCVRRRHLPAEDQDGPDGYYVITLKTYGGPLGGGRRHDDPRLRRRRTSGRSAASGRAQGTKGWKLTASRSSSRFREPSPAVGRGACSTPSTIVGGDASPRRGKVPGHHRPGPPVGGRERRAPAA